MVKDELRKLLNQPYKSENWKKITEFVFPNVSYLQKPQEIPFESDKIESFKQIGNVKLSDGKNLAMFEVHVAENVNLASNRVELRKLVAPLIDQERNHGVLVIYEQGKEDYRFTFTAKSTEFVEAEGDFKNIETDAKRFTYILGKNESCKTAANRFWELSGNKEKATIKDVEHAFSVERLNKEFFEKYKNFYEDFVQHITGKRFEKEKGKWVEKTKGKPITEHKTVFNSDDKLARNFVKLLLGRLVFIQFLQKKGWMGVPANSKKWKGGEKDFLFQLFNSSLKKDKFHSDVLFELFYRAFNTPNRPNDIFELTGTRVPYLNGGLFENEYLKTELINFPKSYFQDLFDFFGQYNFTIDENDPLDHEVGIDPEMLGHIFENLLEDNKDKGAFYTPKSIVQYMCQESLIQYLKTYLIERKKWSIDEKKVIKLNEGLQNFVRKKIASAIIDFDEDIAIALRDVKICDPAIGSGAFPMGLLNEIFYCIQVLYNASPDVVGEIWKMNSWQADIVKKNIIQHSIYGVDLEKGAVDIARLRFWLSLIVDEKEPYPLPNLDFKIMQGNSLLESYEGIDLSQISGSNSIISNAPKDLFGNAVDFQPSIFDTTYITDTNIIELIESYFNAQLPEKKQGLKNQIEEIIHKHIDFNLGLEEKNILKEIAEIEYKILANKTKTTDSKGVKEKKEKVTEKLSSDLNKIQSDLKNLQQKRKELFSIQSSAERPYFIWHLYFKDVFDKGGFDIVIGNPPYIGEKGNESIFQKVLNSNLGKRFYTRWMDYFYFFFHTGIDFLKENGSLIFITTNYYFTSTGGDKLRIDLKNRTTINSLVNFNELTIFESATGQHNVITHLLKSNNKAVESRNTITKEKGFADSRIINSILYSTNKNTEYYFVDQDLLFEGKDCQIRMQGKGTASDDSQTIIDVLQNMSVKTVPLSAITNITMGIVSLSDTVSEKHLKQYKIDAKKGDGIYVLNNFELNELNLNKEEKSIFIKPFFKNSDIKKFDVKEINELWLIYCKDFGKPIKLPEGLLKHFGKYKELLVGLKSNFLKNEIAASVVKKWFANDNYFVLFTPKREAYFNGEKIVAPYRSKSNDFAFSDKPLYASKDIAFILPLNVSYNLKYLACILNSKLMFKWLYFKGKRKGETLELYAKPLSDIPIRQFENQNVFVELYDKINSLIQKGSPHQHLIDQVDMMVYKLYELNYNDVKLIDPEFNLSELNYNEFKIK